MDYKNLYLRIASSFFLIVLFILSINYLDKYLFLIISGIYIVICYEIYLNFNVKFLKLFFLYLYILISFLAIQLYFLFFYDKLIFIYFILIIILFDSSSYFFGSLFGKKKIFSNLSPSKTHVGLFFGIIITFLFSFIVNEKLLLFDMNNYLVFNVSIILFSFIGDIFESYFKRKVQIKDSSNFIPGHGGFFDRFDGFIMSTVPLLLLSYYFE